MKFKNKQKSFMVIEVRLVVTLRKEMTGGGGGNEESSGDILKTC